MRVHLKFEYLKKKSIFKNTIVLGVLACLFCSVLLAQEGSLSKRWELDSIGASNKSFKIIPYKPVYLLIGNYTNTVNTKPFSANPNNVATENTPYTDTELKFQLSFKVKAYSYVKDGKTKFSFWAAYTQNSRWQFYNAELSRPFRETNYEPELFVLIPTKYKIFGLNAVFASVGFNHQSNGRSNPYSRSWNRIILQSAWEKNNFGLVVRAWWRLQEDNFTDDNPNIEDYVGRAELLMTYKIGKNNFSLLGRHSLKTGDDNRGSIQIDYAKGFSAIDNLKVHLQFFHGYGDSLIDFNHQQTVFGFGISLLDWL